MDKSDNAIPQVIYFRPIAKSLVTAQARAAGMSVSAWMNQLVIREQYAQNNAVMTGKRKVAK